MEPTNEQYAGFGAYVAGVMDEYLMDDGADPGLVVEALMMGAKRLGIELAGKTL